MASSSSSSSSQHFILIHGACHGAWCWYKVKPLLEGAGHKVTAIDMAASGIDNRRIEELKTLEDYSEPLINLMRSIPSDQKVVLVGHSLGGFNIALAAQKFPEKVSVLVFLAAFMPDFIHRPSYVLEKYNERTPTESWEDTKFESYSSPSENQLSMVFGPKYESYSNPSPSEDYMSMFFGPNFMSHKLYQLCSPQDLALGTALLRPSSLFLTDLKQANNFSEERFGFVPRVYIACKEDKAIPIEYQRWMIENFGGVNEVKEMEGVDHMAMLSSPDDLCKCLFDIADKYA
ncbi:salicylic acid-binding protein 2-like [Impatiens glandulifera]|uniref:salicylic acid-binding protein 2-like n=1 Tax=Impatiens glandulifera TaxID=253017 RepID=UPI001FB0DD5A|nr:salicylic acid-binding protein 2-like [Impatiens glandulifera]